MILTMAYLVLIATLICVAALLGERISAELGWPRRSAWLAALVASVSLPVYAIFFDASTSTGSPIFSLPLVLDVLPAIDAVGIEAAGGATTESGSFNWPDWQAFDSAFVMLWAISSAAMLLFFIFAGWRLNREIRKSEPLAIGDQDVLLSDHLGPAVLGFIRPRIVLPHWLARQESALRSLVLTHEREHIAARDQLTLLAALLLVAMMPWNVSLWWQLRRLRAAMEVDCDSRVLRNGANARDYSKALLAIGRQSLRAPFGAVALTEPVSELERRIRIMMDRARKFSLAGFGVRSLLIVTVLGLAIAVNAPSAQQPADQVEAKTEVPFVPTIPTIRTAVYDRLSAAQVCMDEGDSDCTTAILDELSEQRDLNVYETAQIENFYAFSHFGNDQFEAAAKSYENILALPRSEIPAGMIQSSMRNLATLYLQFNRFEDGLDTFERWMNLPLVTPSPNDHYLKATILYQMERYEDALEPLKQAMSDADEPVESYYQLLYVLQHQTEDQAGMMESLETLNERWPKEQWAKALEGAEGQQAAAEEPLSFGVQTAGTAQAGSSEYLPIVKVAPIYPPPAATRGTEGYVVVRYTVDQTGSTRNVEVVESSDPVFDSAAVASAEKYKYKPRVIDGTPVEVAGVTTRIIFQLEQDP